MSRDGRYDILFEPLAIGPLTAKNRFYQVPHCNGGGYRDPSAAAAMRGVKAEGGWAVLFTEQCEIHPSSEITPYIELRLWDDRDIPALARMAEQMKRHGALAGIELVYPGINGPNLYSKEIPLAPSALPIRTFTNDPVSARAMSRQDIRDLRRWYVNAARRARLAGFDLICVYGAHGFGVVQHFLSTATNQRGDEYGGSLYNRARLVRELFADLREAVGEAMALALRLSLQEIVGELGFGNAELRDFIEMHAELPDLWDLAHGSWEDCSGPSRFTEEAAQQELVAGIKRLTPKPVVGVGRFTSPDLMARQVRAGILDFIGCARPSIADPFLPQKIEQGRVEDIRECIGCNVCISGDMTMSISRCTQNPSFMEEWRKGWHPERIEPRGRSRTVLVIGAGPAGLEAARAAAERGYEVVLAEAGEQLGGRVARERRLPGLSAWGRVADYREQQLTKKANVEIYRGHMLSADEVLEFGYQHVAVASGSLWRRDGVARQHLRPVPAHPGMPLYTPDDLMTGSLPDGRVVLFDDDHYYMGGVLAELLAQAGAEVTLITPAAHVSEWTLYTLEQGAIHRRLAQLGVIIELNRGLARIERDHVLSNCVFTDILRPLAADAVVMVASRLGEDRLYRELLQRQPDWAEAGVRSLRLIGDAEAPGPIAWATYAGHRYARELDAEPRVDNDAPAFRREITELQPPEPGRHRETKSR